jgi:hypothetical protein
MMAEREGGGMLYGDVPSWVGITIVPLGFALLAWHFAFEALLGLLAAIGIGRAEFDARRAELTARPEHGMPAPAAATPPAPASAQEVAP